MKDLYDETEAALARHSLPEAPLAMPMQDLAPVPLFSGLIRLLRRPVRQVGQ